MRVVLKIIQMSLQKSLIFLPHTHPFHTDTLAKIPLTRTLFSLTNRLFFHAGTPSRTFSGVPHAPLTLSLSAGLKPFSAPFQMLSEAALTDFSESPQNPSHPLCHNDSSGEKVVFCVRVQRRRTDCQGRARRCMRKSSGSRRHLSRTLSEAPQTPLIHSNVLSHIPLLRVPQRSSQRLLRRLPKRHSESSLHLANLLRCNGSRGMPAAKMDGFLCMISETPGRLPGAC